MKPGFHDLTVCYLMVATDRTAQSVYVCMCVTHIVHAIVCMYIYFRKGSEKYLFLSQVYFLLMIYPPTP